MSDKLKQTIVNTTFADGELITSAKLNGAFAQMETAVDFIDKAIGDINNQNTANSTPLSTLPSSGPSLGRLVGSANWLNPKRIGLVRKTIVVQFRGDGTSTWYNEIATGSNNRQSTVFRLPFQPILIAKNYTPGGISHETMGNLSLGTSWDSGTFSFADVGFGSPVVATMFQNQVAGRDLLSSSGDYHVSYDGVITTYDQLANGDGFTLTYNFDTIGDAFTGATLNVIPDLAQYTTLCTVTDLGSGTYQIDLPTVERLMGIYYYDLVTDPGPEIGLLDRKNASLIGGSYTTIESGLTGSPSYGEQCVLPETIVAQFSDGDTLPEGYIYLWDEIGKTILNGGTFTYKSSSRVEVTGLTLTASTNYYRIVVPGSDITRTVSVLKESYVRHTHKGYLSIDGVFDGEKISHADLHQLGDEGAAGSSDPSLTSSQLGPARNPHPQYLHRFGYDATDGDTDGGNRRNALLGDLVLAEYSTKEIGLSTDSYALCFGSLNGPIFHYLNAMDALRLIQKNLLLGDDGSDSLALVFKNNTGPKLYFDNSEDALALANKGLKIETSSPTTPSVDTIYTDNIVKAKGTIQTGTSPSITGSFNINPTLSYNGNQAVITFVTPMSSNDYTVQITDGSGAHALNVFCVVSRTLTKFEVFLDNWSTGSAVAVDLSTAPGQRLFFVSVV